MNDSAAGDALKSAGGIFVGAGRCRTQRDVEGRFESYSGRRFPASREYSQQAQFSLSDVASHTAVRARRRHGSMLVFGDGLDNLRRWIRCLFRGVKLGNRRVTKGNNFFAQTASSCTMAVSYQNARRACIYQGLWAFATPNGVATLTGFEPVLPP